MMRNNLGQLVPVVEDDNLLAVLLSHLPLQDRLLLSRVCRKLCKQVRAVAAVKLAFTGNEGDVAAVMPLARAFTGAVAVTCKMGPCLSHNRATAALLRHAADTWPYITSVTLELTWTHPQAYVNPVALVGPLNSLALMPHLTSLSLHLPRLERLEMDALLELTGLTRLQLTGAHADAYAWSGWRPVLLPKAWLLSRLVGLRELSIDAITPGLPLQEVRLPTALTAVTILSDLGVRSWAGLLKSCSGLQQLCLDSSDHPDAMNVWDLLRLLAPSLVHLTSLTLTTTSEEGGNQNQESGRELPEPCFLALHSISSSSSILSITRSRHWRLLAACPSLKALRVPLMASKAPPPDLGHLGLTQLSAALSEGWAEAGALLRHCPLMEEVVITADDAILPETLPLVHAPLQHLQRVQITAEVAYPQLVEVLAPSLCTTRSLTLDMPLATDGVLPDLSACCHLTQLVWKTLHPLAVAALAAAAGPEPDDLLWSLRGCQGLVELTLCGWDWLDARLALALAGAHPCLRRLRLERCGVLPGNSRGSSQQRLQRIRSLLRPSLVLEVV